MYLTDNFVVFHVMVVKAHARGGDGVFVLCAGGGGGMQSLYLYHILSVETLNVRAEWQRAGAPPPTHSNGPRGAHIHIND